MKDLKNLTGAKILSKKEQQSVKGGIHEPCGRDSDCEPDHYCAHVCIPERWGRPE